MSQRGGDLPPIPTSHFAREGHILVALSILYGALVVWWGRNSAVTARVPEDEMVPGKGGLQEERGQKIGILS